MNGRGQGQTGFTLIELMITVAIVAILATIAYGSYINSVRRGHRVEAKSVLMQNAAILERNFTEANRYDQTTGGDATKDLIIPKAPPDAPVGQEVYDLKTNSVINSQDFTLVATPQGTMASDDCGSLTLNNLGQQNVTGTASVADCWRK